MKVECSNCFAEITNEYAREFHGHYYCNEECLINGTNLVWIGEEEKENQND